MGTTNCRLCFRSFVPDGLNEIVPRAHKDNTVCHYCWAAGTDQSDAKSLATPQCMYGKECKAHDLNYFRDGSESTTFTDQIARLKKEQQAILAEDALKSPLLRDAIVKRSLDMAGLSPDAPTEVTPQGGKHSRTGLAFHQLPASLMFRLASVLYNGGAKYGRDNWKSISVEDHINHALMHIFGFLEGDTQDDHLAHAIIRLMFADVVGTEGGPYHADN